MHLPLHIPPLLLTPSSLENMFGYSSIFLGATGLLALADLPTISQRTALTGSASFLDIFVLAPGIQRQQTASEANGGELPTTGALTTGYVFRVENQGTVSFLQRIGRPGCLVNVFVAKRETKEHPARQEKDSPAPSLYFAAVFLTPATLASLVVIRDLWAIAFIVLLMVARLINVVVVKRRTVKGWKGIREPGVEGDLLTLLSQDRWVRMRGLVDDLKDVTAGQWLRDQTTIEGFASSAATLLVYVAAALAFNASTLGSLAIACLLLSSAGILGLCNSTTRTLQMFDCVIYQVGEPQRYERRRNMADDLIRESGRKDWAIGMGLITPPTMEQARRVEV